MTLLVLLLLFLIVGFGVWFVTRQMERKRCVGMLERAKKGSAPEAPVPPMSVPAAPPVDEEPSVPRIQFPPPEPKAPEVPVAQQEQPPTGNTPRASEAGDPPSFR